MHNSKLLGIEVVFIDPSYLGWLFADAVKCSKEDIDGTTTIGSIVGGPDHQVLLRSKAYIKF